VGRRLPDPLRHDDPANGDQGCPHHIQRKMHPKIDPRPGHRQRGQQHQQTRRPQAQRQQRKRGAEHHRSVIAGEAVIRRMTYPGMAEGDHKRPRMKPERPAHHPQPEGNHHGQGHKQRLAVSLTTTEKPQAERDRRHHKHDAAGAKRASDSRPSAAPGCALSAKKQIDSGFPGRSWR
jgi:hypothetical protein